MRPNSSRKHYCCYEEVFLHGSTLRMELFRRHFPEPFRLTADELENLRNRRPCHLRPAAPCASTGTATRPYSAAIAVLFELSAALAGTRVVLELAHGARCTR